MTKRSYTLRYNPWTNLGLQKKIVGDAALKLSVQDMAVDFARVFQQRAQACLKKFQ